MSLWNRSRDALDHATNASSFADWQFEQLAGTGDSLAFADPLLILELEEQDEDEETDAYAV